jgi:hypothetical protein
MFFSEEKNQKTFASGAHGEIQAMAGEMGAFPLDFAPHQARRFLIPGSHV